MPYVLNGIVWSIDQNSYNGSLCNFTRNIFYWSEHSSNVFFFHSYLLCVQYGAHTLKCTQYKYGLNICTKS